jgi:hypothetical protein
MPMRAELSLPATRLNNRSEAAESACSRISAKIFTADFVWVLYLCVIGLMITACFIMQFPDFGEMSGTLQQFP